MSFDISSRVTAVRSFRWGRATIGVSICEDIWYPDGPVFQQAFRAELKSSSNLLIALSCREKPLARTNACDARSGQHRHRCI